MSCESQWSSAESEDSAAERPRIRPHTPLYFETFHQLVRLELASLSHGLIWICFRFIATLGSNRNGDFSGGFENKMLHARVQNGNTPNIYSRLMVVFSGISPCSPSRDRFKSKVSSTCSLWLTELRSHQILVALTNIPALTLLNYSPT